MLTELQLIHSIKSSVMLFVGVKGETFADVNIFVTIVPSSFTKLG